MIDPTSTQLADHEHASPSAPSGLIDDPAQSRSSEPALPPVCRILFLDDDPERAAAFLGRHPQAVWVQTVEECVSRLVERWDEVHLDHDLGGKMFVDSREQDCGMEVIRWLCKDVHEHLRVTRFLVHTHNSLAGLLMVLQMRASGYQAEFCPFGFDPAELLRRDDDDDALEPDCAAAVRRPTLGVVHDRMAGWVARIKGYFQRRP